MIQRKLKAKLDENVIEQEHIGLLEEALREDMEDLVQEQLEIFRNTFETVKDEGKEEESSPDCYGPPEGCAGFYWGGEDGNEIIYYD